MQHTELLNQEGFMQHVDCFINECNATDYSLVVIGIERFEHFGDWYGEASVQKIQNEFAQVLAQLHGTDAVAGHMGDDKFAVMMRDDEAAIDFVCQKLVEIAKGYKNNIIFLPKFGIYRVENEAMCAREMYKRALIALDAIKGDFTDRSCRYEPEMLAEIEKNRRIIYDVHNAMENGEFTFYLQPQYNMATGKIIGMEALVRWIHPERGIISPKEFLPALEENGLICNLDLYLWEKVCEKLRSWIDMGIVPVPISVNVSRVELYNLDVVECFKELIKKYDLDPKLVEIEITENAYTTDNDRISKVVDELRKAGFVVLMDDFGSAYSSLNMLKNVNVDVLKLDMKFLKLERDNFIKGFGIVETVLRMARFMGLKIVMEGVETEEQLNYLVRMGCMFGQGYYMDRPMPVEACEAKLIDANRLDYEGMNKRTVGRINTKELMQDEMFSEIMMNGFMGGLAVYEVCGRQVNILQVNEHYEFITGLGPKELEDSENQELLHMICEEDRERVLDMFDRAYARQLHSAECEYQRKTIDGRDIWVRMKVYFLREQDGKRRFCGSVKDVTIRREKENELERLKKKYC